MARLSEVAPSPDKELPQLAREVQRRHRAFIRQLRLEPADGGLVVEGEAYCFYGKQMAQEELRRRGHRVICNRVRVDGGDDGCCSRHDCSCQV